MKCPQKLQYRIYVALKKSQKTDNFFLSSKINYTRIQFYSKSVHGPVLTNINYWRKLIIHESKKHFTSRDVSMMISYGFCISQKLFLNDFLIFKHTTTSQVWEEKHISTIFD